MRQETAETNNRSLFQTKMSDKINNELYFNGKREMEYRQANKDDLKNFIDIRMESASSMGKFPT